MEIKCYEVAGVRILIQSDFETLDSDITEPFLIDSRRGDINCCLMQTDHVPEPQGGLCHEEEMMSVWRDGSTIYRSFLTNGSGRRRFMLSKAEPGAEIQVWILKTELSWAAKMGYIWLAIGLNGLLLRKERLVLHSSVVETPKGAILFVASSGTGKSTQAALWEKYEGAQIINGDRCAVGMMHEMPCVYGVPMAGTSGISEKKTLPLGAIVCLSQAPENQLHQLRGSRALLEAGFSTVIDRWDDMQKFQAMDLLSRIMEKIPVYHLACRPDRGAVEILKRAMEGLA